MCAKSCNAIVKSYSFSGNSKYFFPVWWNKCKSSSSFLKMLFQTADSDAAAAAEDDVITDLDLEQCQIMR